MVQTDPVALAGLVVELLLALGYLYGVNVANTLHRRRSSIATAAFLGGLAVLAVALQSRLATYDDVVWVHHLQHVLVMSIAPPLLALGAPVTLSLQVLSPRRARGLVALLHHPALRAVCGPRAAWHVPLDYYGVTALYLFTPAHGWSETSTFAHVTVHAVLLTCGLLFWVPIVGVDATGWRPSYRTRLWLVGAGVPVNAVLAVAAGSWSLLLLTEVATLLGLALVVAVHGRAPVRRPRERAAPAVLAVAPVARP